MKVKITKPSVKTHLFSQTFLVLFLCIGIGLNAQTNYYQDCPSSFPVCDMKTYHFDDMGGVGQISDDMPQIRAKAEFFKETNSIWLKWKVAKRGSLSFIITPNVLEDDIDFVIFKKTNSTCISMTEIRSLTTGQNIDDSPATYIKCSGIAGLADDANDEYDHAGCTESSDNFLKSIDMNEDDEYVLFVNNFESTNGFSISFTGDAVLQAWDDCILSKAGIEITRLFPNPTKDYVTLEFSAKKDVETEISLSDIKGRKIFIKNVIPVSDLHRAQLETDRLAPGSYIVQIKQSDKVSSKMLIKI